MKIISAHTFKHTLRDIHKNTESRKFCFILGAGASLKSGIPTGAALAKKWFTELGERLSSAELKKWMGNIDLDEKDIAASYGSIYRKRFENDKASGYEFLVQAMKDAKPTLGHVVLGQILSRVPGHCVLTTNFDSLIESAVYQYTTKTPLVCGHESLSGYARPSNVHPLIIKVHRDLLMAPQSDPDEIDKLNPGWVEPLDSIFSTHIPVVIGYGGNDGSLMNYFESMKRPSNFFWCGLDKNDVSEKIKDLIVQHDGSFVTIDGFDELMHNLLLVFDEIGPMEEELQEITNERINIASAQFDAISEAESPGKSKAKKGGGKEFSALEYYNLADKEPDFERRKQIFLDAVGKYPVTGWLWWKFTYFLHFIKEDFSALEIYYPKSIKLNNNKAGIISNYAIFLHHVKKDYEKAEEFYSQAYVADPDHALNLAAYASFLSYIKKDYDKAEEYYLKAFVADRDNANNLGNYANFLCHIKKDNNKAGEFYLKAIVADPKSANNLGNYAVFLHVDKKNYKKAEEFYVSSLAISPDVPNYNGNYAQLLLIRGKFKEAKPYLKAAFEGEENELLLELWFYQYAHYSEFLLEAEKTIEELLSNGVRSLGWDFGGNIKRAVKDKHPNPKKLKELAKRITTELKTI